MSALKPGTPLPWKVLSCTDTWDRNREQVKVMHNADNGGTRWIADCAGGSLEWHEGTDANAAYIVQACNAYPDLVEALDKAVLCIERNTAEHWADIYPPDVLEAARAALKKARGEA